MTCRVKAAVACAVLCSLPAALSSAADVTATSAGQRYGQALSVVKFCPGGKLEAAAEALPGRFTGADAETFQKESANVTAAWDKAFACIEVDPATNRYTQCRKMRLTSCRQAWIEIGPEGRDMPGLISVDFSAWAEKHKEAD